MIYLNEECTRRLISRELAYQAVKEAFQAVGEKARLFPVVNAAGEQNGSLFSLKSACTPEVVGWKTGTYWPENKEKGLPCHNTAIFLLDPDSGSLMAVIEAGEVNAYRTAAADAVATDALARKNASILSVFGTGHQAFYDVCAICAIRDITQVWVIGRGVERAKLLSDKLKNVGIKVDICQSEGGTTPQQACQQSDIILTVTTSQSPVFEVGWIQTGTHISAMGGDKRGKQQIPPELYKRATLFCDFKKQSRDIGEFQHTSNHVKITEIHQVLSEPDNGRVREDQITVFDSSGIALQDLFVARKLLEVI